MATTTGAGGAPQRDRQANGDGSTIDLHRRRWAFAIAAAGLGHTALARESPANVATSSTQGPRQTDTARAAPALFQMPSGGSAPPTSPGHIAKEHLAFVLYPQCSALELAGVQQMLAGLQGANVHLLSHTLDPVPTDTSALLSPTVTWADCPPELDLLLVPGGLHGTLAAMQNETLVSWLAAQAWRSKLLASVGSGSLLLGQAGLLRGRPATSHWLTHELLPAFGARPLDQRIVWDVDLVTAAGGTAGIDLGLELLTVLRDPFTSQCAQLLAEYAPEPMYDAGSPHTAPPEASRVMGGRFEPLLGQMQEVSARALKARSHSPVS